MGIVGKLFKEKKEKKIAGVLWLDPYVTEKTKGARVQSVYEMAKKKSKKNIKGIW